jgi:hypothetical protein
MDSLSRSDRRDLLFVVCTLLALSALALWPRLTYLDQPMRQDESRAVICFAEQPAAGILTDYSEPNNHILHTLLVRVCILTVGEAPWQVRLPTLIAGLLLIGAAFLLGREFHSPSAGLLLAGFVAANSALVEFSVNARGHLLVALFAVLAAWQAHHIRRTGRGWIAFVACSVLGCATVPTMAHPFAATVLWLALARRGSARPVVRPLLIAVAAVVLLTFLWYLPALLVTGPRLLLHNAYVESRGFTAVVNGLLDLPGLLAARWHRDVPVWLAVAVAALALAGLLLQLTGRERERLPIFGVMLFVITGLTMVQQIVGPPRVWLWLLPFYGLSAATGMVWLLRRGLSPFSTLFSKKGTVPLREDLNRASPAARWNRDRTLPLAAALALAFAGAEARRVAHSGEVARATETGRFLGAAAVAERLKADLRPGDCVVYTAFALPTLYYAQRIGLDPEMFYADRPPATRGRRYFVQKRGQNLTAELLAHDLPGRPVLLLALDDAELYRIDPVKPETRPSP